MPEPSADREHVDQVVAGFDPAMVIVTTAVGDERSGCLVGFHSQSSIEPLRYVVWMSTRNHTASLVGRAAVLAVHALAADQHRLAEIFGGHSADLPEGYDKFDRVGWAPGPGGVPILDEASAVFVGRVVGVHDFGGDHRCVELDPFAVPAWRSVPPLRLSDVGDVEPGHPA